MPTDSERSLAEARIQKGKSDFQHVLHIAIRAKHIANGTETDRRGDIADTLLLRSILTGVTISQALSPATANEPPRLTAPDLASIAVLARTILETFLTMFSIALQEYTTDEAELRLLWWDWHDVNERIRALKIIRTKRPEAKALEERRSTLSNPIARHPAFKLLPAQLRKTFTKGERPRQALWESNGAIAVRSGIRREHFDLQYQFLSAAAHSQPMIVRVLRKHDPHAREARSMMNQSLAYATAYLAFSVCGFSEKFPAAKKVMDARFVKIAEHWAGVFAKAFGPA